MSIRFSKYVRIVSGVGGAALVQTRDLIGRIFSLSPLISPDSVLEFTSAADVGEYFGTDSTEYFRAALYFAYTSPAISSPRRISFARFAPSGAAASVFGGSPPASLANLKLAVAGTLSFSFDNGASNVVVSAINLSAATSLADVAALLQTALQANADPHLSASTVTYDAPTGTFRFSAGVIDNATVQVNAAGAGVNDLRTALAWNAAAGNGAVYTSGVAAQTVSDAFIASEAVSNNFGSFVFDTVLTLDEVIELATLNAARNVTYQFMVPVLPADAASWAAGLFGFAGTALTLSPAMVGAPEYPEMIPMIQLAATDYTKRNAVVNYMFKQFGGITPSVRDDATSDAMDAIRVNYYGRTQTAGQTLDFYQRGLLMGGATAPVDMNVFANEQWLKDAAGAALMSLLIGANRVPANAAGRAQILGVVQESIDQGLLNGVISVGKTLTAAQKVFISQQSGDELAWHQVQNIGYWVDAVIVPYVGPGGTQEYKAVYTLLYSKDDAVRLVEGTHSLI
jgi:uncharacterized protein DUF3383